MGELLLSDLMANPLASERDAQEVVVLFFF